MKKHPITSFNIQWQSYGFESPSVARQQSKGETEAPSFFRGSIKAINAAVRKTAENCCIDLLPTTASCSIYPERASATQKHFMAIVKIKICSTEALRACLTKPPNNKIARVYCCTKYESKCSPFHIKKNPEHICNSFNNCRICVKLFWEAGFGFIWDALLVVPLPWRDTSKN